MNNHKLIQKIRELLVYLHDSWRMTIIFYDDNTIMSFMKELFDIIIAGINIDVINNSCCTTSVDEDVMLYPLITSINAWEDKEISREYIEAAFDKISNNANLTEAAKTNWNTIVHKLRNDKSAQRKDLTKIVATNNKYYYDKYVLVMLDKRVNMTVRINVWDRFDLNNIRANIINHKYYMEKALKYHADNPVNKGLLISDLRRCFAIIDSTPKTYIFKGYDALNNKMYIESTTSVTVAKDKFKGINIINGFWHDYKRHTTEPKSVNLWTLVHQDNNSHYLTYLAAEFYSTNPDVFSYYYAPFQRCTYDTVDSTITDYRKMNNLERWLHHVNTIICSSDEEAIQYVHAWIARPLQNPIHKNKTALIIKDINQGTGKSWFAEIVAKLHGSFGNSNVGDMKHICGNFNSLIENKTLMVINELENADNSKYYDDSKIKDLISEETLSIERKGADAKSRKIFANFIFISNNETPIRVTDKDRRYVVLRPSAVHGKDDYDYWSDAFYNLKYDSDFLAQLYSYYMDLDISYYNPRAIPKTLALAELIEQSRPRIHDFIIENYESFVDGWAKDAAFNDYLIWCKRNNYQNAGDIKIFTNNLSEYIEWCYQKAHGNDKKPSRTLPRKRINGKLVYMYKLNDEYIEQFKPTGDDDDLACIEDMKAGWEIDDTVIKDICKKHQITVEQLCKIYNGNAVYIRNGKRYDIALSSDNSCLLYARQIGNSIKYYPIKDNRFEFN